MKRRNLAFVLFAVALVSLPVLVALAAPARTGALSGAQPVYEWKGAKESGVTRYVHTVGGQTVARGCESPLAYCDDTLLEVQEAGAATLVVEVGPAQGENDFDLYVYESDSSGAAGAAVGLSEEAPPKAEKVTVKTPKKGFYLARITYFDVADAEPTGKATVTGLAAPVPTETATASPSATPTAQPTATPTPSPAPQTNPQAGTLTVRMSVRRQRIRTARKRGLPVRISCSTGCRGTVELRVDKRTARRLGLARRAARVGRARVTLASRGQRLVRVRFTRRARSALTRAKSVKLTARAVMSSTKGTQRVTVTRRTTLRR